MRVLINILMALGIFCFCNPTWADLKNKRDFKSPSGRVLLDYPRGRFQEGDTPSLFRWNILAPVKSITVRVYQTRQNGDFDPDHDTVARFDLLGTVHSARVNIDFTEGKYLWVVESFDDVDPKPVSVDWAEFSIEPLRHFDMTTTSVSLMAGFSRGTYTTTGNYKSVFDITPTLYGVDFAGDVYGHLVKLSLGSRDFTLQGSLEHELTAEGASYFKIYNNRNQDFNLYVGPDLKFIQLPLDYSDDGKTLLTQTTNALNAGVFVFGEHQIDYRSKLYSELKIDTTVNGSGSTSTFDTVNVDLRAGLFFGLFWPIGFSGEAFYQSLAINTHANSESIQLRQSEYGMLFRAAYAF